MKNMKAMKNKYIVLLISAFSIASWNAVAQLNKTPSEEDYYKILTLPTPEGILLEVGGVATMPDGRIAVSTRRGDVWMVENPAMENGNPPKYTLYASGLHEALGAAQRTGETA